MATLPALNAHEARFMAVSYDYEQAMRMAETLFLREPKFPSLPLIWDVVHPTPEGGFYGTSSRFGRYRWYEQVIGKEFPKDFRPRAAYPQALDTWESWKTPKEWIAFLKQLTTAEMAINFGSSLAALQFVVDVLDHLVIRRKIKTR